MRRYRIIILLAIFLFAGAVPIGLFTFNVAASETTTLPDYVPTYIESGLAGKTFNPSFSETLNLPESSASEELPSSASTPEVGTTVWDWYLSAITDGANPFMTLRGAGDFIEVWVANDLSFPEGDPRNDDPYNIMISDEMINYLIEEFDNIIYSREIEFFGKPNDRDGTNTIFELIGWPSFMYDWISTDNPQRIIVKILNIRDENYYDPSYPYYVAGFYSPLYTQDYYNRNMVHIDCWRWWQRLGPEGMQWFPEDRPDLVVTRPHVYESTLAHEYQHNIHDDLQPNDDLFMNEGCSMYAELLCGYPPDPGYINTFLATPDNSLTIWGDQGDINILADYGQVLMWTTYLVDHYSTEEYKFLSKYMSLGPELYGVDAINQALIDLGFVNENFETIFHDWKIANMLHTDHPGNGKYNYKSINLDEYDAVRTYEITRARIPWTMASEEFGETITILGYPTGMYDVGPFGTDYIYFKNIKGLNILKFDGDDYSNYGWTWSDEYGGWYSGEFFNLYDALLISEPIHVNDGDQLTIDTWYNIEEGWDFGFVQVSEDGGETWISLENEYTTYDHDPDAHQDIIANLPGLTGELDEPVTMNFDLGAYNDRDIIIGFRYMTDWAYTETGWVIYSAKITNNDKPDSTELSLTQKFPIPPEVDFQVTIITKYTTRWGQEFYFINDMMCKNDATEYGISLIYDCKKIDTYLLVSPMMENGYADYKFKISKFPSRCWIGF
ncbi:MAG: hypothetical protein ACTSRH_11965 [Promethearchaeota archaeon]